MMRKYLETRLDDGTYVTCDKFSNGMAITSLLLEKLMAAILMKLFLFSIRI